MPISLLGSLGIEKNSIAIAKRGLACSPFTMIRMWKSQERFVDALVLSNDINLKRATFTDSLC